MILSFLVVPSKFEQNAFYMEIIFLKCIEMRTSILYIKSYFRIEPLDWWSLSNYRHCLQYQWVLSLSVSYDKLWRMMINSFFDTTFKYYAMHSMQMQCIYYIDSLHHNTTHRYEQRAFITLFNKQCLFETGKKKITKHY